MRYLGAIALLVVAFFGIATFTGGQAKADALPPAPLAGPAGAKLNQVSAGTWTVTVYLDTTALCLGPTTFDLLTGTPDTDTPDTTPDYVGGLRCASQSAHPVTEVVLTFTPSPPLSAVPESATLAVTQPPGAIDQGAMPLEVPLTVRRLVTSAQYVWIPAGSGAALALLLVVAIMLAGVPKPGGKRAHMHRVDFWRRPLYASSAWTFGDSWATNITVVGTLVGSLLTASGSVAELLPGLELSRFALVITIAGGITIAAPLLFSVLNYRFSRQDPVTAGMVAISLPFPVKDDTDDTGIMIGVPAGGTLAVHGQVVTDGDGPALSPGATVDVPAGAVITVSAGSQAPRKGSERVLVFPGDTSIVVTPGQHVSFSVPVAASGTTWTPVPPRAGLVVREGATISFVGQASVKVPADARVEAPAEASPMQPQEAPRRSAANYPREFVIPRGSEVVAARMWVMLAASCMTVFGIGAEIGVTGWVLGYDLIVAPQWARVGSVLVAALAALLVLVYGVGAIRSLADARQGTTLSGRRGSSFML